MENVFSINNDYIEDRRDSMIDDKIREKKEIAIDPGFISAVSKFIKQPDKDTRDRRRKMERLRTMGTNGKS